MNKIILLGSLIRDPELKHAEKNDRVYTRFVIAVSRNFKLPDGRIEADFINIVAFGKKAEIMCKYLKKGSLITLSGSLRTGSYESKDGIKKYSAEVVVDDFKFLNNRKHEEEESTEQEDTAN